MDLVSVTSPTQKRCISEKIRKEISFTREMQGKERKDDDKFWANGMNPAISLQAFIMNCGVWGLTLTRNAWQYKETKNHKIDGGHSGVFSVLL